MDGPDKLRDRSTVFTIRYARSNMKNVERFNRQSQILEICRMNHSQLEIKKIYVHDPNPKMKPDLGRSNVNFIFVLFVSSSQSI